MMAFDFSPLPPDQMLQQQAFRWLDAKACVDAYLDGLRDAAREDEARRKVATP